MFAHPDDESFGPGGTFARYAAAGVEMTLVCGTRGEAGSIGHSKRYGPDLLGRIRQQGLDPEAYRWYLDLRRHGTFVHSGFGLGIERTVAWICGIQHIREAIAFPRQIHRLYP